MAAAHSAPPPSRRHHCRGPHRAQQRKGGAQRVWRPAVLLHIQVRLERARHPQHAQLAPLLHLDQLEAGRRGLDLARRARACRRLRQVAARQPEVKLVVSGAAMCLVACCFARQAAQTRTAHLAVADMLDVSEGTGIVCSTDKVAAAAAAASACTSQQQQLAEASAGRTRVAEDGEDDLRRHVKAAVNMDVAQVASRVGHLHAAAWVQRRGMQQRRAVRAAAGVLAAAGPTPWL